MPPTAITSSAESGEREGEVQGVDGLADEDAAPVAGIGPAAGLVVVALLTPPGNRDGGGRKGPERPAGEPLAEPLRDRPEPVLEDDAEGHPCPLRGRDDFLRRRRRPLDRLLHEDVLAGGGEATHELGAGVGRGEEHRVVDRRVVDDRVEITSHGKAELRRKGIAPGRRRAVRRGHFHPVVEVEETLRVRGHRHPEPDDRAPHLCPSPRMPAPFVPLRELWQIPGASETGRRSPIHPRDQGLLLRARMARGVFG